MPARTFERMSEIFNKTQNGRKYSGEGTIMMVRYCTTLTLISNQHQHHEQ